MVDAAVLTLGKVLSWQEGEFAERDSRRFDVQTVKFVPTQVGALLPRIKTSLQKSSAPEVALLRTQQQQILCARDHRCADKGIRKHPADDGHVHFEW